MSFTFLSTQKSQKFHQKFPQPSKFRFVTQFYSYLFVFHRKSVKILFPFTNSSAIKRHTERRKTANASHNNKQVQKRTTATKTRLIIASINKLRKVFYFCAIIIIIAN